MAYKMGMISDFNINSVNMRAIKVSNPKRGWWVVLAFM